MSTVIAFPTVRRKATGRPSGKKVRKRDENGPVIVILPVVRIERHDTADAEMARPAFGPGSRKVR